MVLLPALFPLLFLEILLAWLLLIFNQFLYCLIYQTYSSKAKTPETKHTMYKPENINPLACFPCFETELLSTKKEFHIFDPALTFFSSNGRLLVPLDPLDAQEHQLEYLRICTNETASSLALFTTSKTVIFLVKLFHTKKLSDCKFFFNYCILLHVLFTRKQNKVYTKFGFKLTIRRLIKPWKINWKRRSFYIFFPILFR